MLNQRSTGATIVDYNVAPVTGVFNEPCKLGEVLQQATLDFRINGNTPRLEIDSINNAKRALLRLQTNVRGRIYVPVGCTLNLNAQTLLMIGNSIINNGFIDGRATGSNFVFFSTTSAHYMEEWVLIPCRPLLIKIRLVVFTLINLLLLIV